MTTIQPIETRYAGHRFRSRLEARWAVFMDHLGIPWDYEPQGYVVDGTPYLPDFLVRPGEEGQFWLEIKGVCPTEEEVAKAQGLASGTKIPAFIYWAKVEPPAPDLSHLTEEQVHGADQGGYIWTDDYGWREYPTLPPAWQIGLVPTAFRLNPSGKPAKTKSGFHWWTECTFCGHVRLSLNGQQGWCPAFDRMQDEEFNRSVGRIYPQFGHRTARVLAAYDAARSARFEHGQSGA
ncbi:hypothetical protein [Streptomyces sp. JV180]|uniref:hypothetical protein n=1 Tax=Streptomyces sp. JV180 TaxID=858634 RepID=UPI00168A96A4|nr:hypothetical protein [Streptomyces sp. JV180]MBD3544487.1 hypothetical protein [Streptomyces sp. JV180]